jgi:hemerythrin-like domain-containing protein
MRFSDELEHDHQAIEAVIALLTDAISHADDATAFAFAGWALDFFRRFADACHHAKEERVLFPLLEARGIPRRGGPIGMMLLEHEEGRRLLAAMERAIAARERPRLVASAGAYGGLLRAHIAKERGVLFPFGETRIDEADDRALAERFAEIERSEGGEALHARLHAELSAWRERLGPGAHRPASEWR